MKYTKIKNYYFTAEIANVRRKKHLDRIPFRNQRYIRNIELYLFGKYAFTAGTGAVLMSNGFKGWRAYALNRLDIDDPDDYFKIGAIIEPVLDYKPYSCKQEKVISEYTGKVVKINEKCSYGRSLYERIQFINNLDDAYGDTDRYREFWEVQNGGEVDVPDAYEDNIIRSIEKYKV